MRYVVIQKEDSIEAFWCYYTDCDTCKDRFKCFTESAIIVNDCINMKTNEVMDKLKKRGINVKRLAEF